MKLPILTIELFNHDAHFRINVLHPHGVERDADFSRLCFDSLKAVRILSHNARWAAKLERKRRRGERKAAHLKKLEEDRIAREEEEEKRRKVNPFASKSSGIMTGGLGGALFGGDANPFGATAVPAPAMTTTDDVEEDEIARPEDKSDESDNEDDQAEQMAEELAIKASLETKQTDWADRDWSRSAPAYEPAQYLTTFAEPSSSVQSNEEQKRNKAQMQKLKQNGIQEVKGWEAEKYESMMAAGVDDVFQRFLKRVSQHGKQLVRYEFGGTPLPFHAKGKAYDTLWPKQKRKGATIVTGQAFSANGEGAKDERDYTTENVARCLRCGSRRVFEMQLMPNLINTLRPKLIKGGSDGDESAVQDAEAERRREIEEALGHRLPVQPDADGITRDSKADQPAAEEAKVARRTGLRWNTAMVFVCEADCHDEQAAGMTQSWSEEVVELQTEHEQ